MPELKPTDPLIYYAMQAFQKKHHISAFTVGLVMAGFKIASYAHQSPQRPQPIIDFISIFATLLIVSPLVAAVAEGSEDKLIAKEIEARARQEAARREALGLAVLFGIRREVEQAQEAWFAPGQKQ